jgi:hypothetical protein
MHLPPLRTAMHKCAVSLHSTHLLLPLELSRPAARALQPVAPPLRRELPRRQPLSGRAPSVERARPDDGEADNERGEAEPDEDGEAGRSPTTARRGGQRAPSATRAPPRQRGLGHDDDEAGRCGQRAAALGGEEASRTTARWSTGREASRTTARRGPRGGRRRAGQIFALAVGGRVFWVANPSTMQEANPWNG